MSCLGKNEMTKSLSKMIAITFLLSSAVSVAAQGLAGSWFEPTGAFRACLENPAIPCAQTNYGPSEQERTMHSRVMSVLHVSQTEIVTATDSSMKFTDQQGNLDFRLRLQAPLGTSVGMAVDVPYPLRRLQTDSIDQSVTTDQGQVTLLLGSELLSLGGEDPEARQHLFLGLEIPMVKDDGKWGGHLEWVNRAGLRARASVWILSPHQDLMNTDSSGPVARETWHEVISQGLVAARPFPWLELGVRGTRSQVTPRGGANELKANGDVWQGASSVQFVGSNWRFSNTLEWQREDLRYAWNEDTINPWTLHMQQKSDVWDYTSRLQRSFGAFRLALYGEKRYLAGEPNRWNLLAGDSTSQAWANVLPIHNWSGDSSQTSLGQSRATTNILGTEVRYLSDGFFVEPGVAWAQGHVVASANPWQTWGIATGQGTTTDYHAVIASCNIGLVTGGSKFQYSFRQAFPTDASPWRPGLSMTWGASHRFTVEGGF